MKNPLPSTPALSRRSVFVGAGAVGAVGALAAATTLAPALKAPAPPAQAAADPAGGYQLTDHVKQYYATARI